jgi:murein DD-endopeptidase MepM/ murein hydrolase activator NlpD
MARAHHTIVFVPHARAKLRKWRITNLQIGLALGGVLLLTLSALGLTCLHLQDNVNPAEIARLRQENGKLRQVNSSFESSIRQLQDRLTEYEDRTRQLALVAGVESLGDGAGVGGGMPLDESAAEFTGTGGGGGLGAKGGIGGGAPVAPTGGLTTLHAMANRVDGLDGELDAIAGKLQERVRWISSTPSIAPVKGILTSGFGYRSDPLTHGRGIHQGIDLVANPGQPVRASADGVVTLAGERGGLGRAVYLAHGFGVGTRYGHLSRIDVQPGQRVKRGDVIGLVGNTGRSTGYHLHYEVRIDGEPVNPVAYILDETDGPL